MNVEDQTNQRDIILFTQLVLTLHHAAMQYLGKLVSSESGVAETNLEQAKITIDTLDMLRSKCKGNLSDAESRMIDQIVSELKLNYVDEMNRKPVHKEENIKQDDTQNETVTPA